MGRRARVRLPAAGLRLDAAPVRQTAAHSSPLMALAVSPYFVIVGHLNLLDAGLHVLAERLRCFAFTLAQMRAAGHRPPSGAGCSLAWAAAALAVLSKGIVVGVLAGGALILYTLIERDVRPWRRLHAALRAAALSAHRRAVVHRRDGAQPELPGVLLRARALRALPDHRAPAGGALVVLPAAAAARGPALDRAAFVRGARAGWTAGACAGGRRAVQAAQVPAPLCAA